MAGGIFRKHDVAGPEASHRAVAGLDFNLSGKGNDILAPWRRVIITPMGWRHATKDNPLHRLKLGYFHVSTEVEFNLDFFEVRFVVRAGIKSNDLHEWGCRRIDGKKQGAGNLKPVPIVPAVSVVPNVQFRFMSKIDDEAPKSASSRFPSIRRRLCRGEKNSL